MTCAIQRQQRWHSVHLQSRTTVNWNLPSFFIVTLNHNQSGKQKKEQTEKKEKKQ